ncbi:MAG TPA: DUF962 domain-containing protein [Flavobacteriaceae bacterium]|jgi:hypothetical protein|nr:DUF962 domain-containing protein [Flavobacteriaceae bacterium]HBS12256.1 DUF962 domain-containing protein [Flavobacteriaceae bacterium]
MATDEKFTSLKEFYPFYLTEHSNSTSRILHFIGTGLVILLLISTLFTQVWSRLWFIPVIGYGFAWVGHFFFEKNKPATFQYPFYSLTSDFILFWHLLIGKEKFVPLIK